MKTAEVFKIDVGDNVLCDYCNEDYTNSLEEGGMLIGSYAVCPKCSVKAYLGLVKHNELHLLKGISYGGESFRDFVLRIR